MSLNKFSFIGNLTKDTEVTYTAKGTARATIDMAINQVWYDDQQNKQERADFFRIKCFGKMATNAGQYLGKGSKIYAEGKIHQVKYDKDGQTIYGIEFVADIMDWLVVKNPGHIQSSEEQASEAAQPESPSSSVHYGYTKEDLV